MLNEMRSELKEYFRTLSLQNIKPPFNPLKGEMEAWAEAHPNTSTMAMKAKQYEIIADGFTPVLFRHNPFFFETGLKISEYNGMSGNSSGGWLGLRNTHILFDSATARNGRNRSQASDRLGLHLFYGYFDSDHHCFPAGNLLTYGLSGILARLEAGRSSNQNPEKAEFYDAAERGIFAVKKMAEKILVCGTGENPAGSNSGRTPQSATNCRNGRGHAVESPSNVL